MILCKFSDVIYLGGKVKSWEENKQVQNRGFRVMGQEMADGI